MKKKNRPTDIEIDHKNGGLRFTVLGKVVADLPEGSDELYRIEQTTDFIKWRLSLNDLVAITTIDRKIRKFGRGLGTAELIRDGLHALKVDYGPGYRLYLGKIVNCIVLLFGGGTKIRQQAEINRRVDQWKEIKRGIS